MHGNVVCPSRDRPRGGRDMDEATVGKVCGGGVMDGVVG